MQNLLIYIFFPRLVTAWQLFMEERKERGLGLEVSISDAGARLNVGIPKAFPEISVRDVPAEGLPYYLLVIRILMEYRFGELLESNYGMARQEFKRILDHTKPCK